LDLATNIYEGISQVSNLTIFWKVMHVFVIEVKSAQSPGSSRFAKSLACAQSYPNCYRVSVVF